MKRRVLIVATLLFGIVFSFLITNEQASAHATLETTTPQTDGVVSNHPDKIELKFNEPVNAKYSGITLYDDEGNKITDLDPETEGSSATLSFSTDDVGEGTHTVEWHAMSADGHEVGDQFQFSVGEVTASDVDTSVLFYQKADFWFGVTRYLSQGALIGLIGLFWMNELVRRRDLPTYEVIPEQKGFTGILMMLTGVTLVTYLMTLTSDILADIFAFKMDTITQFPFILSSLAIIILLALLMITNMMRTWYILVTFVIILALSMSGHAWSQTVPVWSIIIRFAHMIGITLWIGALIYLSCYAIKDRAKQTSTVRPLLLKVNITAVAMIIISGVLMAIDETDILAIWQNIQTWSALLIVKIVVTIAMMGLGFYQTTRALKKQHRVNKASLFIELGLGILLIGVGVVMSQINLPK
ncbi:copper resistance CopC/CopD family protein [Staphylococcus auricularis]|uniref:Copper resistance protein CopC n=1 Tax=Staphylococcus auricularis TaxID=29379 RepID=A0ABX5IHY7_9STAP|nr:copper resistance protein CopC [Staphylococcus auricularis]MCE5039229.1 copper resistance protein CopC/CopD [Staphylococcus auricularis]MEB6570397.1 copper resistance protein CopC/CopD [Staphylococcus auricularis]PTH19049.1 copper resistance protein CopC [Staphylococcus auricularis]PTH26366.1 copper resistance protein CopC [Staphylococcus auricularis]